MLTSTAPPSSSTAARSLPLAQRLAQLPRDTRDTLFLLGLIGWVLLLQLENLPVRCSGLAALVLLWRGILTWRNQPLPSRWWLVILLALTIGATLLTYRTIFGRDAGVTLIAVLLALKTLELRARRDAFVVFFLALFTLLTHFSYSQSLVTAVGVLLAVWGLLTALVNAHMPAGRPSLWVAAKTAGGMALLGAPIMVVLFMLFPRMAPLWGVPVDASAARTGLSDRMQVGQVAQLAQDTSVALRVKFDGPPPPAQDLYFRGPVLSRFDGIEWRPQRSRQPDAFQLGAELRPQGQGVRYEVTLQPHQRNWVMVLDAAPTAPDLPKHNLHMTADLQWLTERPITELARYRAESFPRFTHGPLLPELGLQDFVDLPPGFNPRTLALAQQWRNETRQNPNAETELVQRALTLLRTGGYQYTLSPGVYGQHSADEFWFDRKLGFCEHIAAAFVILMRGMDIPARIVTGYQGGEANPIDQFWTVRQSDAHAWAEVWLTGQGWVRVDPTSSVSPSRTSTLETLEPPRGVVGTAMFNLSPAMGVRLRATWDAVNNRWNQWVLNYSQDRQLDLLKNLGFDSPSWRDLGYVLAGLLTVVSLAGAAWTLWERRQHDPWLRLLQQARQRTKQLGIDAPPHATPRQLAALLQQHCATQPETTAVVQWLLALETIRYASPRTAHAASTGRQPAARHQPDTALLRPLQQQFKTLRWPQANTMPVRPPSSPPPHSPRQA